MLRDVLVKLASGSIPRHGIKRTLVFPSTHARLAAMAGYKKSSSYTRNSLKAPKLTQRTNPKRVIKGSSYSFKFGEGAPKWKNREDFSMPSASEMRQVEGLGKHWEHARSEYSGYTLIPGWVFHPDTPGTPFQKQVLFALAFHGMFKLDANGHCDGHVQKPLATIGKTIGVSRDAVRSAVAFYEADEIFQVKHYPARYMINGQVVRGGYEVNGQPARKGDKGAVWIDPPAGAVLRQLPNSIYYVAGREFDQEKCEQETQRFLSASKSFRDNMWWEAISGLHAQTLREWRDTRQLVRTFWKECRKRMAERGVPTKIIEQVVPRPPD